MTLLAKSVFKNHSLVKRFILVRKLRFGQHNIRKLTASEEDQRASNTQLDAMRQIQTTKRTLYAVASLCQTSFKTLT